MTNPAESVLDQIRSGGRLRVVAWEDPLVDRLGHDPRSFYVERFWLPVLGPSTTFLLRMLALVLDTAPSGAELDAGETAGRLGLGRHGGRHAPFARTLARCVDFEMARPAGTATLAVRRRLPPLARRHLVRLSEALAAEHERWHRAADPPPDLEGRSAGASRIGAGDGRAGGEGPASGGSAGDPAAPVVEPSIELLRRRGRQLARSLLDLGEEVEAAEHQLLRWHYHPALARECVLWAAGLEGTAGPAGARGRSRASGGQ